MRISERRELVLRAARAEFGTQPFTAPDLVNAVAGLAAKKHPELAEAMGERLKSEKTLGHFLKAAQGTVVDGWRLCARRDKRRHRWRYRFISAADLAADEVAFLEAEEFEDRMSVAGPMRQINELTRQLEKIDAREQIEKAQAASDALQDNLEAVTRAAAEQVTAAKVDEWDALDGVRLYTKYRRPLEEISRIVATINRPQAGVHARPHAVSDTANGTGCVVVLLTGSWQQRKHRWQQLEALFRSKGWASQYEGAFDGVTAELKHGAAIPASASQDPRHYDTSRMTEQIANSLAAQGVSSIELPIEEAVRRNQGWQHWNAPRGDGVLNPYQPHIGRPVPMAGGFDPIGDSNPNSWTHKL